MTDERHDEFIRKDLHDKDHDMIATEIKNLNSRLDDVKGFIGWGFAVLGLAFVIAQVGIGYLLYVISITPK